MKQWLLPICFLVVYTGVHFAGPYSWLITFGFMPLFFLVICVLARRLVWAQMAYLQIAFLFIISLSIIAATNYTVYFQELQAILYSIALLFLLFALLALPNVRFDRILLVIACKFLIMSAFLLMNFEDFLMQFAEGQRVTTGKDILINSNQFGYFGFLGGAALLIYFNNILSTNSHLNMSTDLSKRWLKLLIAYVFLVIAVCAFLGSRGGFLINFFFLFFLILQVGSFTNRIVIVMVSIPLIMAGIIVLEGSRLLVRMTGFAETGQDIRVTHFIKGMERVVENPFGHGAGHFPVFDSYGGIAHNTYMYVAHDYGVQGLLLLFLIMILLFHEYIKADRIFFKKTGRNGGFKIIYMLTLLYFFLYDFIANAYFWPVIFALPKIYQYLQSGLDEKNRIY